ncbi:MAG: hypothetical protein K8J08_03790, partial [Thermoanaerobaculia bacterium]|nr:hypothetical protein [Thermoanaerobaculia bacterium]
MTKVALLVLGPHRTGTSALARTLGFMGGNFPSDLLPPVEGVNPTGYWEPTRAVGINDQLLERLGLSWSDPSPMPDSWMDRSKTGKTMSLASDFFREEFEGRNFLILKDPRICRTLPLWNAALGSVPAEPRFAVTLRHPFESANSLARVFQGLPWELGLWLWLRYMLDAEKSSRGQRRCWVPYDELLNDTNSVIDRLELQLGLERESSAEQEATQFLRHDLRHEHWNNHARESSPLALLADHFYRSIESDSAESGRLPQLFDDFAARIADLEPLARPFFPLYNSHLR